MYICNKHENFLCIANLYILYLLTLKGLNLQTKGRNVSGQNMNNETWDILGA
uniref:Uncharacterized protein n=1 Tax=Rhizophora mucronata TaxID=61149 RepID=A0A2P2QQ64_RHIMU